MWKFLYLVFSTIILFKWRIKHVPGQINTLSDALNVFVLPEFI